jgi:hypothetical protein
VERDRRDLIKRPEPLTRLRDIVGSQDASSPRTDQVARTDYGSDLSDFGRLVLFCGTDGDAGSFWMGN